MRILYYTSGTTGSGRVVRGLSIYSALKRAGIQTEYTILSGAPFAHLADRFGVPHIEIPLEGAAALGPDTFTDSELYRAIVAAGPDILLVDLYWMPLYAFIRTLACKTVLLCRQVADRFFAIPFQGGTLEFRPGDYNLVVATEPFTPPIPMQHINPMIIRNREEILSRRDALEKLGLDGSAKTCLLSYNGEPGEFRNIRKTYSYLEDQGYQMVYSTNYEGGLFPAVDYFNAFDFIVTGAAYNSFWEAVYFRKEALFVPVPRRFEDQHYRVEHLQEHRFEENGADQLVKLLMAL